jgi:hypothetical protein
LVRTTSDHAALRPRRIRTSGRSGRSGGLPKGGIRHNNDSCKDGPRRGITSYPAGAQIFVDDELRGTTPQERLAVTFFQGRPATVRLQLSNYQSAGAVVLPSSPPKLSFFLAEAPFNQAIIDGLRDVNKTLGQIHNEITQQSRK